MRHNGIAKRVLMHITIGIRSLRSAEKRKRYRFTQHTPPVLGVVEDGHAPFRLGEVRPLVTAHFESGRVPRRVFVIGPRQATELSVKSGLSLKNHTITTCKILGNVILYNLMSVNSDWKFHFQELSVFFPVDRRLKLKKRITCINVDALFDATAFP